MNQNADFRNESPRLRTSLSPAPELFDGRSHIAAPCATEYDQHGDTADATATTRHPDPRLGVWIATSCMAQPQQKGSATLSRTRRELRLIQQKE
jgi:hypothetical protein